MEGIIREATTEEKRDFIDIGFKSRNTAEAKFTEELQKQEKLCGNTKPFASQVARLEFKDHYDRQAELSKRKNGYVDPNDIKPFKVEWSRYSDLKNFDIIGNGERVDDYLTKINPGLTIKAKWTMYRFKGYSNTYRLMESGPESIERAQLVRIKLDNPKVIK